MPEAVTLLARSPKRVGEPVTESILNNHSPGHHGDVLQPAVVSCFGLEGATGSFFEVSINILEGRLIPCGDVTLFV